MGMGGKPFSDDPLALKKCHTIHTVSYKWLCVQVMIVVVTAAVQERLLEALLEGSFQSL